MKNYFSTVFLLFVFVLNAQTSERYEQIKKDLKAIAVYDTVAKYKNGALKFKGSIVEFDTEDYVYYRKVGKFERFYRKGSLMRTSNFDSSGLLLNEKFYDPAGGLFCEYELIEFDTTAKSAEDFLITQEYSSFIAKEKNYRYNIRLDVTYLYSVGLRKNGKKIGTWEYFDVHGNLKKEKEY